MNYSLTKKGRKFLEKWYPGQIGVMIETNEINMINKEIKELKYTLHIAIGIIKSLCYQECIDDEMYVWHKGMSCYESAFSFLGWESSHKWNEKDEKDTDDSDFYNQHALVKKLVESDKCLDTVSCTRCMSQIVIEPYNSYFKNDQYILCLNCVTNIINKHFDLKNEEALSIETIK